MQLKHFSSVDLPSVVNPPFAAGFFVVVFSCFLPFYPQHFVIESNKQHRHIISYSLKTGLSNQIISFFQQMYGYRT